MRKREKEKEKEREKKRESSLSALGPKSLSMYSLKRPCHNIKSVFNQIKTKTMTKQLMVSVVKLKLQFITTIKYPSI